MEDIRTKGECCFNHIIGLPTKEGLEKPIFDYHELLYEALLSPDFCNSLKKDVPMEIFIGKRRYCIEYLKYPVFWTEFEHEFDFGRKCFSLLWVM